METTTAKPVITRTPKDIHQEVTDKIIKQLEKGCIPWQKPWMADGHNLPLTIPKNCATGKKYRGINIVLLWSAVTEHNFQTHEWGTIKQWNSKKEIIRAGEKGKGNFVVYYDTFEKEVDGEIQKIPFLKSSVVFNKSQLASFQPAAKSEQIEPALWQQIDPIDTFIDCTGAIVEQGGDRAFYSTATDKIAMPLQEAFINTETCTATEGYYSTLLHELTHWTGNEKRLNRVKGKKFGDQQYAAEELVAEFGSAFRCANFGINAIDKGEHVGYIENWLKALRDNKQFLFYAANEASKAVDYLNSLQPQ
jgi:antirestriction protein ArdC